jgi:UDP-N-acetylmuramoyl-L-alanyl-D-glutamate--2,6-diaminopimelate ligase
MFLLWRVNGIAAWEFAVEIEVNYFIFALTFEIEYNRWSYVGRTIRYIPCRINMWQSIKNVYHLFQSVAAITINGFPSKELVVIGVTGTDGKTTTSSLIYHILRTAGHKAALISTVGAIINDKVYDVGFHVTTPSSFAVQSYIKKAKKAGVKYLVLETTSHALDQHRVTGIHFDVGVVTNITKEHLDYHKTYERYVAAKVKLLKKSNIVVINKDDRSYEKIRKLLFPRVNTRVLREREKKVVTYGLKTDAAINPHDFKFSTKLVGKFNQYNCLAAAAALLQLHISDESIRKGIASYKAPAGRQEVVYNKDFMVINDFAHTPASFAGILPEAKKMAKGRLIHVFGSAGKRDAYKRPEMGKASAQYSDIIVLTAEDPRDESVEKITGEIARGISDSRFQISDIGHPTSQNGKKYLFKISDRKEAIGFAVGIAQKGDVVLLTGKGHEKSMNYGKGEEKWDESEIARSAIELKVEK